MANPVKDALIDISDEVILLLEPAALKTWLENNYKDLEGGWYVRLHQSSTTMTVEEYVKGET